MEKTKIPEYNAWRNMRQRCLNKKCHLYKYYGGRGIKICKKWDSYDLFLKDIGNKPHPNFELDRINVDGNYCKRNCWWVDKKTQQRNQRRTVFLTFNGITMKRCEWAEVLKINPDTIRKRLARGKDMSRALSQLNHRYKNGIQL